MANSFPSSSTPADLGYAMPAEWAAHSATWLSWPHNLETWPTQLEKVRDVWVRMVAALSPHEQVYLLVNDGATRTEVAARKAFTGVMPRRTNSAISPALRPCG